MFAVPVWRYLACIPHPAQTAPWLAEPSQSNVGSLSALSWLAVWVVLFQPTPELVRSHSQAENRPQPHGPSVTPSSITMMIDAGWSMTTSLTLGLLALLTPSTHSSVNRSWWQP